MKLGKIVCLVSVALAIALAGAPRAEASIISYDFSVDVTSGPLNGTTENGSFSYDSSSVIPGGEHDATGLLTALDFTFNGITYNAGTANTGRLIFNSAGTLTGFVFGNDCFPGFCGVTPGTNGWWASPVTNPVSSIPCPVSIAPAKAT